MRLLGVLVTLFAATLSQAQLPNVPRCSLNCFLSAMSNDGCENLLDFACHCQKPQLVTDVTPCVRTACPDHQDQSSASNAATSQCSSAGHPISIPPVDDGQTTTSSYEETSITESFPHITDTETEPITSATVTLPTSSTPIGSFTVTGPSSSLVASSSSLSSTQYTSSNSAPHSSTPSASSTVFTGAAPSGRGDLTGAVLAAAAAYWL